jgi:hypothetical protein
MGQSRQSKLAFALILAAANAKGAIEELRRDHAHFISPEPITFKETELGFAKALWFAIRTGTH